MRLPARQLEFALDFCTCPALSSRSDRSHGDGAQWLQQQARELLRSLGADKLAREVRVEWNPRLKTAAGHTDYREKLISLNPLLLDHASDEINRTLRHELAHLLAQFRKKRRRIAPHGPEWREACRDLGIADEARCHNLLFAMKTYEARYIYVCPNCKEKFPRVRRVRRAIACLACCRKHNGGDFDLRFRLKLVPLATPTDINCNKL
ncbi:MAG TPA: SprT-like domain-containing protein [Chthoniobacterales bacterium]|jgi:predicted SprT family Zn-dependent metalloprotease|nr:SprT-like domain-containing protein [Chthoniobacterales bacterium]